MREKCEMVVVISAFDSLSEQNKIIKKQRLVKTIFGRHLVPKAILYSTFHGVRALTIFQFARLSAEIHACREDE